jgi:hypothetical protein
MKHQVKENLVLAANISSAVRNQKEVPVVLVRLPAGHMKFPIP